MASRKRMRAGRRLARFFQAALATNTVWPAILVLLLSCLAAVWVLARLSSGPETLGAIWVDSPEVYTRERLVNDRFVQDAWLQSLLNQSKDVHDALQVRRERINSALAIAPSNAASGAAPAMGSATTDANAATKARLSSRDLVMTELDFRELIRTLAIENQLDDRHDMHGHSLYRLKFDAVIAPGNNTQASAQVEVCLRAAPSIPLNRPRPAAQPSAAISAREGESSGRVASALPTATSQSAGPSSAAPPARTSPCGDVPDPEPPDPRPAAGGFDEKVFRDIGGARELDKWRTVYRSWIDSLRSRLNQTYNDLRQAYEGNEFSDDDYAKLIRFLRRDQLGPNAVPACRRRFALPGGPDAVPRALNAAEHLERKRCVAELTARPPDCGPNPSSVGDGLRLFFASRTIPLVLGIPIPEEALSCSDLTAIPAVGRLSRLATISLTPGIGTFPELFDVRPKTITAFAIDTDVLKDESDLNKAMEQSKTLPSMHFAEFKEVVRDSMLRIHTDIRADLSEEYSFVAGDFQESNVQGILQRSVEVGLINFATRAGANTQAYSYAVTPKESGDAIFATLQSRLQVQAGWRAKAGDASASGEDDKLIESASRRPTVVGYGVPDNNHAARFGWIIAPRVPEQNGVKRHDLGQYSLSALVSMPSWWDSISLKVTTSWLGRDGAPVKAPQTNEYSIRVPVDFESLETTLMGVDQQRPELAELHLDPVLLTACSPGSIVIPGRRLWRSARVTLGYQTADEISVLPDMKGIIATFHNVQNQATLKELKGKHEIRRSVRIWTSQGSTSLPLRALIAVPPNCGAAEAKLEVGKRQVNK